ncbi:MAG TPA: hypothetical protein VGO45_07795 [Bacteroidia bacterium]|jgi:HPt (histidine-containing phosphotransfer) domain-containing protein|nr:hypothetical protein [Bacteroidia bacterium]
MKNQASASPVSNLEYLTDLSKGNTAFVKEMLGIFLEDNPGEVKTLGLAIEETDYDQIRAISHHMMSTMPFVGLNVHLGKELAETEELAKTKTGIQLIKTHFAHIKEICEKACEELAPILKG